MTIHISATTGCNLGCTYTAHPEARVLTADLEWTEIQNLDLGDEVVSFDNPEYRTESDTHLKLRTGSVYETHEYYKNVVRVETDRGNVKVAAKHPFLSKYHGWREAKDFTEGQEIRFLVEPESYEQSDEYEKGYVVGAWRGDGTTSGPRPMIRCNDSEIPKKVSELSNGLVDTDFDEKYLEAHGQEAGIATCNDKSSLLELLELDRDDVSKDFARGWLAGLFDTDGAFDGTTIRFTQQKSDVRATIARMLGTLGYGDEYVVEDDAIRFSSGYGGKFELLTEIRPKVSRKVRSYEGSAWKGTATVQNVEHLGEQRVFDVAVSDQHTLCLEGFMSRNCYENPSRERKQEWVDRQYDMDSIMSQLEEWREKHPNETPGMHGGEPLLVRNEDLETIFSYVDEHWEGESHIQTNGTLLEEEHVEMFEEYGVSVGISCDGPPELNRERKAAGERDSDQSDATDKMSKETHEAIEKLVESDVTVGIIVVLHETNAGSDEDFELLLEWMDWLNRHGVTGHFNPAIPYEDVQNDISLDPETLKRRYLRTWEWMKEKSYRSWNPMGDYVDNLLGNKLSNCVNNQCDVQNAGAAKIIKGNGATTGCGKTWSQVGDGVPFLQGDSTGNEFDDEESRYEMLKQTPGPYTEGDAPDLGGCKGCKYWNVCYDDETEVLTADGWKYFENVTERDEIATLDQDTHEVEYHTPVAKQVLDYDGELIHWTGRNYDLRVTPDHNVFARSSPGQEFQNHRASEIEENSAISFKRGCEWDGDEMTSFTPEPATTADGAISATPEPLNKTFDAENWFRLMGWYLAEGSCSRKKTGNHRVSICQRSDEYRTEIVDLLDQMGFSPHVGEKNIEFDSKQIVDHVEQFGRSTEKYVPDYIKSASSDLIRTFLIAYAKGDGCLRDDGTAEIIYTGSKKMADDLQELGLKADWPSTIGVDDRDNKGEIDGRTVSGGDVYYVTFAPGTSEVEVWTHDRSDAVTREEYSGTVYDLTVPNHTMYVRRNGNVLWSGNCQGGCPSAGMDDDFRNRTVWCEAKYALYEKIEHDMRAIFPNIRLVTDTRWNAEISDAASGWNLDIKPFAAMRPGVSGKSSATGSSEHEFGTAEDQIPDEALPEQTWEERKRHWKEKYDEQDLEIDEEAGYIHADSSDGDGYGDQDGSGWEEVDE